MPSWGNRLGCLAFSLAMVSASASIAQNSTVESVMDRYLWHKRPLIVAAPDSHAPLVSAQRDTLAAADSGLTARDMVRVEILGENVTIDDVPMPEIPASRIRDRYGIAANDALALLIGKDGGVKIRRQTAITAHELFETIDAMPMRRREMRTGN